MIRLSTDRWKTRHNPIGKKPFEPKGSHYWRFTGEGKTTGRRKTKYLKLTVERDGPFPKARDEALDTFRRAFGANADIVVELLP